MISEFYLQDFQSFWAFKDIIVTFRMISFVADCRSQAMPHHVKNWSQETHTVSQISAPYWERRHGKWVLSHMPTSVDWTGTPDEKYLIIEHNRKIVASRKRHLLQAQDKGCICLTEESSNICHIWAHVCKLLVFNWGALWEWYRGL